MDLTNLDQTSLTVYAIAFGFIMATMTSFAICWGYRHERGISIVKPVHSFCDNCGKPINHIYTIPVIGTILCKGTCKKCNFIFSKTSFIFELVALILFSYLTMGGFSSFMLLALGLFWSVLMFVMASALSM